MKKPNPFPFSDNNKRYYSFDYYLRQKYGSKCAKVPLDAGFTCPNRDGSKGYGGCTFCSSRGSGDFCADAHMSLHDQFEETRSVYTKKWGNVLYIPYFQAHTNTYGSVEKIRSMLETALSFENTVGIAIATRADCLPDNVVDLLFEYSQKTDLTIELGLQTVHDSTAKTINRCHTYSEFTEGYSKLRGLDVCIHIINGLPGENSEMMLETAEEVAKLKPKFIKFHLLHIISGTPMCNDFLEGKFDTMTREEYVDTVVSQLELLPPDTVIERLTGDGVESDLVAPLWSRKKLVVMNEIDKEFVRRNSMQGIKYIK
ncbi:MAG: TIGR01212 family radical SAM protein [Ruminococcaceae bacterium]|nr:TIGR01212 family radical SAM protein [Oscillospiraceae bacterium]